MLIERNRTLKKKLENFHINFSNSDFSLDIALIAAKLLGYVPHCGTEGSMSQNFDIGST